MTILRERTSWRKSSTPRTASTPNSLPPDEAEHVRAVLRVLRVRLGSWEAVGEAMHIRPELAMKAAQRTGKPSAGLAIRCARLAGVPVDDVLSGAFPKPGACPMCGRCGDAG